MHGHLAAFSGFLLLCCIFVCIWLRARICAIIDATHKAGNDKGKWNNLKMRGAIAQWKFGGIFE